MSSRMFPFGDLTIVRRLSRETQTSIYDKLMCQTHGTLTGTQKIHTERSVVVRRVRVRPGLYAEANPRENGHRASWLR